jgi:hypothetical protein
MKGCLIPRPILPGEKGRKNNIISVLDHLPWKRGWGEAFVPWKGVGVRQIRQRIRNIRL